MSEALLQAAEQVFLNPTTLLIVLAAAAYGVFVGATPGLTATMAVALFVPLTYWLSDVAALSAIVTMTACAIFAGDIPTTLLRIPGTPASAAYADEAYAFTQAGQSDKALGIALVCSVLGGLFGAVVLILFGSLLAPLAVRFGVAEYFWLYLLGLSCAVVVSQGSTLKAMLALLLGLFLSTIGLSAVHTQARLTFGQPELYQGINFIPAMIGLFGLSEVLNNLVTLRPRTEAPAEPIPPRPSFASLGRSLLAGIASVFGPAIEMVRRRIRAGLRSGSIGALIGMLPGAGADIAAWVSLGVSNRLRRSSAQPEPAESPSADGLSDATTANSAALAGGWVPTLIFGIPGDSVTAIVIGVLMMKDVKPGPDIFERQRPLVYSIYLTFLLANLMLLPIGWLAIKLGGLVVRTPRRVLLAVIVLFCVVGSYALNGSYFDVLTMIVMGLVGFLLERRRIPLAPVVLGLILGGPLEECFIQTLVAGDGSPLSFFNRPLAAALGAICLTVWGATTWRTLAR